jgi:hypothetical protein
MAKSDAAPRVVDLPELRLHELSQEAARGKRSVLSAHDVCKAEIDIVL